MAEGTITAYVPEAVTSPPSKLTTTDLFHCCSLKICSEYRVIRVEC
jgi:hypothetical protein